MNGVIVKGIGGFYYINTENGVYETRARGKFRKLGITPLVGDRVNISIIDEVNKKGSLDEILPRDSELLRPRVTNVDQVVIVFGAKSPNINLDLLDRFLILAHEQQLKIVIVINKIDMDKNKDYLKIYEVYKKIGYNIICTSAIDNVGIDELRENLKNSTSVFAGPSGVGKSTLLNATFENLDLETGAISEKIQRGKHTTRHAELIAVMENSYIVDSPGFTSLSLEHIKSEDLQYYFIEFKPYLNECYYNSCIHVGESSCKIKELIDVENEENTFIYSSRYERYVYLFNELKDIESRKW